MPDYFALLNEPRRPALDVEALRERFLKLSGPTHPDRFHSASETEKQQATQKYAELNAGFNCLKEPRDRLLHLLDLEQGKPKDIQRIPPGTMDLFVEVGQLCRDCDTFIGERAKVTSPLLKVQMFEKAMEWTDKINTLQTGLNVKRQELLQELETMNVTWQKAPVSGPERITALPLERLEQIYRIFSYLARWTEQLQERNMQLAI